MADVYTAIGTMIAAVAAAFSLIYMIHVKPSKDKFTIIFERLHEHDKVMGSIPCMVKDVADVKVDVHELTNRLSNLAQGVARIEGKLGCEESK